MPREFYLECPKCGHQYNVHGSIYDLGSDYRMRCPLCGTRYPRHDGKVVAANFPITDSHRPS